MLAKMIGQNIEITMFDSDSQAAPVIFFFDSIAFTPADGTALGYDPAKTDWAMAFGVSGVPDPDGQTGRCVPGSCAAAWPSNAAAGWVTPAYQIEVPGNLNNCDYNNPNMFDCTPFYGGILTARYIGGLMILMAGKSELKGNLIWLNDRFIFGIPMS